jgi:MFS family permease
VLALGALLGGLPGGYALLFTGLALQGAGSAVFATAAMSALAEIGGPERRGAAMSAFQSAFLLAISGGPVVGGWLVDAFGPRAPFLLHAALVVLTYAGVALFPRSATALKPGGGGTWVLLARPLIAGSCAMGLAGFFTRSAVGWALVPASAAHDFLLSPSQTGILVGVGTLTSLLVTPAIGRAIDRIGPSRVLVASGLFTAAALAAFVLLPQSWMLWTTTAAVMIGTTGIMSASSALVLTEATGAGTGAALGLFRTAGDVGITLGPAGAPGLAAALGQAPLHGYSITALSVLAALVILAAGFALRERAPA